MRKTIVTALALIGAFAIPASASAASSAYATTDVNVRAGPSTSYPVVDVVAAGDGVRVYGCLDTRSWCDIGYGGFRGWMSSNYLAENYRVQRYTGPTVVRRIGAPVISFSVGSYWGDHYRSRSFYRDRGRYERPRHREIRREIRRERRDDIRDARRDARQDRRQERRQEIRRDRRDDRRDARQERREDIRDARRDRRQDARRDARQERRHDRRNARPHRGPAR